MYSYKSSKKQGSLSLDLTAPNFKLKADEVHFSNIIFNLIDNAIKYTNDAPSIKISTSNTGHYLAIKISDNDRGRLKIIVRVVLMGLS